MASIRIGEFSKKHQVGLDTIRHYMALGLLIPEKRGSHYAFGQIEDHKMNEIKELKTMGFTLAEIKMLFYQSQLANAQDLGLYESKQRENQHMIDHLKSKNQKIAKKILELKSSDQERSTPAKGGFPLEWIGRLVCPRCEKPLNLIEGNIIDNALLSGKFKCLGENCGNLNYEMIDGILVDASRIHMETTIPRPLTENLFFDYIEQTDPHYIKAVYESMAWNQSKMDESDFQNKVILELGTGSGYFIRNVYDRLGDDATYIVVDHDYQLVQLVQHILSKKPMSKKILYFCCDFKDIPIKNGTVDTLVDYSGSSNYNFEEDDFLLLAIQKLLKQSSKIYGSHIIFKKKANLKSTEIKYLKCFKEDFVLKGLNDIQVSILETHRSEEIPCLVEDVYESYRQIGDVVYFFHYIAIKK